MYHLWWTCCMLIMFSISVLGHFTHDTLYHTWSHFCPWLSSLLQPLWVCVHLDITVTKYFVPFFHNVGTTVTWNTTYSTVHKYNRPCFSMPNVVPSGALNSAEYGVKFTDAPLLLPALKIYPAYMKVHTMHVQLLFCADYHSHHGPRHLHCLCLKLHHLFYYHLRVL